MESFRNACICRYYAFQRNATISNRPLMVKSHPAGMQICYAIFAGISLRLCSISLRSFRITFAAYLPTHIKSLRDFFQSLLNNHRDNLYIISFFCVLNGGSKIWLFYIHPPITKQIRRVRREGAAKIHKLYNKISTNCIVGGVDCWGCGG